MSILSPCDDTYHNGIISIANFESSDKRHEESVKNDFNSIPCDHFICDHRSCYILQMFNCDKL